MLCGIKETRIIFIVYVHTFLWEKFRYEEIKEEINTRTWQQNKEKAADIVSVAVQVVNLIGCNLS